MTDKMDGTKLMVKVVKRVAKGNSKLEYYAIYLPIDLYKLFRAPKAFKVLRIDTKNREMLLKAVDGDEHAEDSRF